MKEYRQIFLLASLVINLASAQSYTLRTEQEIFILAGAGFGSGAGMLLSSNIQSLTSTELLGLKRDEINRFDRGATLKYSKSIHTVSNLTLGISMALPALLFFDNNVSERDLTIPLIYMETISTVFAATEIVKGTVQRTRPFVYNADVPLSEKQNADARKSFFSGHSSAAFASAAFLTSIYSRYHRGSDYSWLVGVGSFSLAAITGYLRYESGKHFPTDILAGAMVGTIIGYVIPKLHEAENKTVAAFGGGIFAGSPVIRFSYSW